MSWKLSFVGYRSYKGKFWLKFLSEAAQNEVGSASGLLWYKNGLFQSFLCLRAATECKPEA